jgi:hypothetical protein
MTHTFQTETLHSDTSQYRRTWQYLEYYALRTKYLFDVRGKGSLHDCIDLYYKIRSIKTQVPHPKAFATIWLYAAKSKLVQEDIFMMESEFPGDSLDDSAQSFFLACFESDEASSQPDIQLCCLK